MNPDAAEPVALPDPAITPGAILSSDPLTVCVSGYSKTVRVSLTERAMSSPAIPHAPQ